MNPEIHVSYDSETSCHIWGGSLGYKNEIQTHPEISGVQQEQ